MNCYFHEEKVSVGKCEDCGKFLCKTCASQYEPYVLCTPCATKRQKVNKSRREKNEKNLKNFCIKSLIADVIFTILGICYVCYDGISSSEWYIGVAVVLICMAFPTVLRICWNIKEKFKSNRIKIKIRFVTEEMIWMEWCMDFCLFILALVVAALLGMVLSPFVIITIVQKIKILMGKDIKFKKLFDILV